MLKEKPFKADNEKSPSIVVKVKPKEEMLNKTKSVTIHLEKFFFITQPTKIFASLQCPENDNDDP